MLRINVHSQQLKHRHQYQHDIINHLQHEKRYYDMQAKLLAEKNVGIDKDKICKATYQVKLEDEAYHERNIDILTQEDDVYKSPWKGDASGLNAVTNSSDLVEITFKYDQKPAARKEPMKDTQTLKAPIRGSHLGKRLRHSESGPTDTNPVVTELNLIGPGGPRAISGGTHTQSLIKGG